MFLYIGAAIIALGVLLVLVRALGAGYFKYRGTRVITCPENHQTAAVEVDALHAATTAVAHNPDLRLRECSRWPEHQDCGQECLSQISAAPEDCLVRNILSRWYHGKSCIYCNKDLGEINWTEYRPALMSPEGKTVEWFEIAPENVFNVLDTHKPVCFSCHVAERFRLDHPELVLDREFDKAGTGTTAISGNRNHY